MENGLEQQVLAKAQKWLDGNYDAETKKQVKYLMDNDMKELVESFYKDLEFGTGGLRGVMGVGTNRMNIYTVGAATQGLSNYLKRNFAGEEIRVVVGHDSRNNSRMFARIGADGGFDSMGEFATAQQMAHFFDRLDSEGRLTKTIVYNLNPAANEMVATMMGNFQDGSVPGKMQWGAAWWFSDQKDGIARQLEVLSLQGLLSRFVGMLTDSRSFLSYPRHEYFRRVLCNIIGRDVEEGELPAEEMPRISRMVEDICYYNAKRYFAF